MSDSVMAQIAALKSAYATLSDVVVEETDAIRADANGLQAVVDSHGREVAALQDEAMRQGRHCQSLDSAVNDVKREVLRVDHKAGDALVVVKSTERSTAEALSVMQGELARLAARVANAEERALVAEEVAIDAAAAAKGAAAELMAAQAASKAAHAATIELRDRAAAGDRERDKAAREMDGRLRHVADTLRDVQAALSSSISAGLTAAHSSIERTNRDLGGLAGQLGEVRQALSALRQQSGEADTSLARDCAMLADTMGALKGAVAAEHAALSSRIASVAAAGEEGRRGEAEERERRIAGAAAAAAAQLEGLRAEAAAAESAAARARDAGDAAARTTAADLRAAAAQLSSLEVSCASRHAEGASRVEEVHRSASSRLDAVSAALHAFANVLNLGQLVVDPKAMLARSMAASGILAGAAAGAGGAVGERAGEAGTIHQQQLHYQYGAGQRGPFSPLRSSGTQQPTSGGGPPTAASSAAPPADAAAAAAATVAQLQLQLQQALLAQASAQQQRQGEEHAAGETATVTGALPAYVQWQRR